MKANYWKKKIEEQCTEAGTMRKSFVPTMDALAQILERRDIIYKQFLDEGAQVVIEKTSDRGAKNMTQNPLFVAWKDLNTQALTYWRELGCTPKGLKQISEDNLKTTGKNKQTLSDILRELDI